MSSSPSVQAVLGRRKPAVAVAPRDFGRPRRMAPERMREVALLLESLLPELEKHLQSSIGLSLRLAFEGLDERDADRIFEKAAEPLCVLRARVGEDPAWLAWTPQAAVGAIETILGDRNAAPTARKLSPTEATVAVGVLGEIAVAVTAALGLELSDLAFVQAGAELGSWREGGEGAEPHRLEVRLGVERGGEKSLLSLYLPKVRATSSEDAGGGLPEHLPEHLDQVEVEVTARLRGCEISLDQLLYLEQGDVIPLDARVGDPTDLCVDGMTLAEGRLGRHRGRLAVRIERLKVMPETLG